MRICVDLRWKRNRKFLVVCAWMTVVDGLAKVDRPVL